MDHRQLEVRAGVVDRHTPGLGEDDLHEYVGRQQQHHDQLHPVHGVARKDRGEGGVARQQGQRAEDEHQRRFDQRAVQGFAAGAHALERTSGVHRREDEGHAAQGQEVGEGDQIAVEQRAGAVDQSRNRQGRQQKKECVECCHLKSR